MAGGPWAELALGFPPRWLGSTTRKSQRCLCLCCPSCRPTAFSAAKQPTPLLCLDVLPGTRIALPSFYHLCPDHPDRTAPLLRYGTSLRSSIASHGPPVTASPSRARVLFGTSHVTSAASQQTATGQRPGSSCQRSAPASPPAFRIGQRPVNRAAFV